MELDDILENEILEALSEIDNVTVTKETQQTPTETISTTTKEEVSQNSSSVNVDASSIDQIANLLKQLVNNKTIEITIKIKD